MRISADRRKRNLRNLVLCFAWPPPQPTPGLPHLLALFRQPVASVKRQNVIEFIAPAELPISSEDGWTGYVTSRNVSEGQKKEVAYRQKYLCAVCSRLLPPSYQVDHIKPLALGGTNGLSNLQALCKKCHTSKTRRQRQAVLKSTAARRRAEQEEEEQATPVGDGKGSHTSAAVVNAAVRAKRDSTVAGVANGVSREIPFEILGRSKKSNVALSLESLELSSLKLLRGMNQQQLAAVVCADGPIRVAAGPGTGKTRVLTARIAHLVVEAKVPAQRILAVTFTNKAARELRQRITGLIGPDSADSITMGTFHSVCLAILRVDVAKLPLELGYRSGFAVYDEYAALQLIKKLQVRVHGGKTAEVRTQQQKEREELSAGNVQKIISAAKNDGYDAQSFRANPPARDILRLSEQDLGIVASVFELYQQTMRSENIVDYDDMLLLTETLFRTSERTRFKYARHWCHITVDEFQDTNSVQYQLVSLLARDHQNIFVVGDADQAIYGWRGADIRNQARFDSEFGIHVLPPEIPPALLPSAAYSSVRSLERAIMSLPLTQLPKDGGGRRLSLELNYRSNQRILDTAQKLLAPSYADSPGLQLSLVTPETYSNDSGKVDASSASAVQIIELEDSDHEAEYIINEILQLRVAALQMPKSKAPMTIAILYRTNAQSMAFERQLVREGVPYILAAQRSFYARKEIRDVLAYLRLLRSNDTIALERVINVPPRKIGAATIATLHAAATACSVSLWGAIELYANSSKNAEKGIQEQLPPLGKAARAAVCRFHSLVSRFRYLIESEINSDAMSSQPSEFDDADDNADGRDKVSLKLVSSELRRRLPRQLDPEGLPVRVALEEYEAEIDGDSDCQDLRFAEGGTVEAAEQLSNGGEGSLAALIRLLLLESGYEAMIKGREEDASRWRNLAELANFANQRRVSEIDDFLDQIALVSDVDALDGQGSNSQSLGAVQLSTIHGAKGLEFDHVFVAGIEEGLLPHFYCCDSQEEVEQERRLLYVAMTRAKRRLTLTHSAVRARWGKTIPVEPSRFFDDLPHELQSKAPLPTQPRSRRKRRFWK